MEQTALEKLPTLDELTQSNAIELFKNDKFNAYLNQNPPAKWVKEHPVVAGHKYVPIDKVELMLKKIFRQYRIEIIGQGTAFNGVWVTARVNVLNPITMLWEYHDGIGACQLQTKKGSSAAQLENINNGALSMAFPIAKTLAIKDACDHFGRLFGSDLNRKDIIPFSEPADPSVKPKLNEEIQQQLDLMTDLLSLDKYVIQVTLADQKLNKDLAFRAAVDEAKKRLTPKK